MSLVMRSMAQRLRRLATVALVPSLIDVGLLVLLHQALGLALVPANVCAIAVASAVSYLMHRAVTFRSDPYVRWVHVPAAFVAIATIAAAVDVAVLRGLFAVGAFDSTAGLVAAKLVSLACAAAVRLVGYRGVLLVSLTRARRKRSVRPPAPGPFRVSVVVPAYNEADRIASTARSLRSQLASEIERGGLEIVFVDDGSTDATRQVALECIEVDQVVCLPRNHGKGAAVRSGVLAARGRTIVFTDADLSYAPDQVARILHAIEDGWDVAIGNRRHPQTRVVIAPARLRSLGSRVINLLSHVVLLGEFHDTQSGLKGFRSDVGRFLFGRTRIDRFAFDVEVLHLVERHGLSLVEVPVEVSHEGRSTVRFGDALRLVWDLVRIRHWSAIGRYEAGGDPFGADRGAAGTTESTPPSTAGSTTGSRGGGDRGTRPVGLG
jgi:dolichyl-phosphate beta-glucosyltransferase